MIAKLPAVPPRRSLDVIFLTLVAAAAAYLRLHSLTAPSLWLDEIINVDILDRARHFPIWRWVIGFEPENGPLYFASELAGRFLPTPELMMRFAPVVFGLATIVLAWLATRDVVFTILLAVSPFHVYYSREGRPYALAMLLATALLVAMLRRARPAVVLPLLVATAYTAASTVPLLGAAVVAAFFAYRGRERWIVSGAAAACIALVPLLYRGGVNRFEGFGFPAPGALLADLHLDALALVLFALAVIGAWHAQERAVLMAFAALPALFAVAALWKLNHFFHVRYLASAFPAFLLLAAQGTELVARRAAPAVAVALALLLARDALREPFEKLDWRGVAQYIGAHSRPGDQVVAANDWTTLSLGFYLREEHVPVRLLNAAASREMALMFLSQHPQGWIVAAGVPIPPPLTDVMNGFPLVRSDVHEGFRLHYVPSLDHFISYRSTPDERRALVARHGGTLDLTDPSLLDSRWHDGVVKGDAAMALPFEEPADRQIVLDVEPASPQQLVLRLNDQLLFAQQVMDRRTFTIDAPRSMWRLGGANRLTVSTPDARVWRLTVHGK